MKGLFDVDDPPRQVVLVDYPIKVAGRRVVVPSYQLDVMPDGSLGVSQSTLQPIFRRIARDIIHGSEPLTADEMEFLFDQFPSVRDGLKGAFYAALRKQEEQENE